MLQERLIQKALYNDNVEKVFFEETKKELGEKL